MLDALAKIKVQQKDLAKQEQALKEALKKKLQEQKELATFSARITAAGNQTFEADWREGEHDDLVLAVAIACWIGANRFTGAWEVEPNRSARTFTAQVPPGVFLDDDGDDDWPAGHPNHGPHTRLS